MTVLPDLEPCAQCDHKRGEHASTAAGSFNVHPVHYGRCRVTGCDCGEYQPKPSSDQSESVGDIARAANAMCAWLYENVSETCCAELDELHPDIWTEAAEVAIRAGRGEFDPRPFTTSPGRLAPGSDTGREDRP